MDLIKENITNLTQLWTTIGVMTKSFHSEKNIEYCFINYSEWPNRLWFKVNPNITMLKRVRQLMSEASIPVKVSVWKNTLKIEEELFFQNNFIKSTEQTGMSVKLSFEYATDPAIELRKVSSQNEYELWSELFTDSFGYKISSKVIMLSVTEVNYFICYCNNYPVGVCLLYHNNPHIIGIHAMGIIPEMRRKGFGEEILRKILTTSKTFGFKYAVLQASKTGQVLYNKYGFTSQFKLNNYQLKK